MSRACVWYRRKEKYRCRIQIFFIQNNRTGFCDVLFYLTVFHHQMRNFSRSMCPCSECCVQIYNTFGCCWAAETNNGALASIMCTTLRQSGAPIYFQNPISKFPWRERESHYVLHFRAAHYVVRSSFRTKLKWKKNLTISVAIQFHYYIFCAVIAHSLVTTHITLQPSIFTMCNVRVHVRLCVHACKRAVAKALECTVPIGLTYDNSHQCHHAMCDLCSALELRSVWSRLTGEQDGSVCFSSFSNEQNWCKSKASAEIAHTCEFSTMVYRRQKLTSAGRLLVCFMLYCILLLQTTPSGIFDGVKGSQRRHVNYLCYKFQHAEEV